jgi:hypothetical protein
MGQAWVGLEVRRGVPGVGGSRSEKIHLPLRVVPVAAAAAAGSGATTAATTATSPAIVITAARLRREGG